MVQDPSMRASDGTNVIYRVLRSVKLRAGEVSARFRTVRCDDCLRLMRWWSRRVWWVDGCAHLRCWRGRLFFKAMVADQIRTAQLNPSQNSASRKNRSSDKEPQAPHARAAHRDQTGDGIILLQPSQELRAEVPAGDEQPNGNSYLHEMG
jgi:hypothetical protein